MPLLPHERHAVLFLLRHCSYGLFGAVVFGGLVLAFDIGSLRTLMFTSDIPLLAFTLFFFGLFVTFGSVAMGIAIMNEQHRRD